eukprot:TRINITY_DN8497_c0_g1_i1.p3 TRINITY_DN8497_c0_g1~~TRINITY_DN8497_c0_g1_i1.p3  ORF type:complete len:58 (-),score=8.65 TRINITY_DN8497_c0_g1_i1:345-518(-)
MKKMHSGVMKNAMDGFILGIGLLQKPLKKCGRCFEEKAYVMCCAEVENSFKAFFFSR